MELCNPLTNVNDLRLMIRSQYALPKRYATKMNRKQVCNAVQKCSGKDLPLPPMRYQKVSPTTGVYYPRDTPLSGRDFYNLFSNPKLKELQRLARKLGVFQENATKDMIFMTITEFLKALGVPEPIQVRLYPNKSSVRSPRSVLIPNNNNLIPNNNNLTPKTNNNNNNLTPNNNNLTPKTNNNNLRPPQPRRVGPPVGGPTFRPKTNAAAPPPPQRRIPLPPAATPRLRDYEELMRKARYGNETSLRSWGRSRGFDVGRYRNRGELFNGLRRQQRDKLNVEDLRTLAKSLGMKNISSYKTKNGLERAIYEFKKTSNRGGPPVRGPPVKRVPPPSKRPSNNNKGPPPPPSKRPSNNNKGPPPPQIVEVTKAIKNKNVSKLRKLENSTNSNVAKTAKEARIAVETKNNTKFRRVAEETNKTALRNLRMYASRKGVKNASKYETVETLERAIKNVESRPVSGSPNAVLNAKLKETRAAANAARAAKNNRRAAELREREMKLVAQIEKNKAEAANKLEREKAKLVANLERKKAEANAAKAAKNAKLAAKLEQEKAELAARLERKKAEANAARERPSGLNFSLPNVQVPKIQKAPPEVREARREKVRGMFKSKVQKIFDEVYPGAEAGIKREANKFVAAIKKKGKNASSVNAIYAEIYGNQAQLEAEGRNVNSIMAKRSEFKRKLLGAVATVAQEAGVPQTEVARVISEEPAPAPSVTTGNAPAPAPALTKNRITRIFNAVYKNNQGGPNNAEEFKTKIRNLGNKVNANSIEEVYKAVYALGKNNVNSDTKNKREKFTKMILDYRKSEANERAALNKAVANERLKNINQSAKNLAEAYKNKPGVSNGLKMVLAAETENQQSTKLEQFRKFLEKYNKPNKVVNTKRASDLYRKLVGLLKTDKKFLVKLRIKKINISNNGSVKINGQNLNRQNVLVRAKVSENPKVQAIVAELEEVEGVNKGAAAVAGMKNKLLQKSQNTKTRLSDSNRLGRRIELATKLNKNTVKFAKKLNSKNTKELKNAINEIDKNIKPKIISIIGDLTPNQRNFVIQEYSSDPEILAKIVEYTKGLSTSNAQKIFNKLPANKNIVKNEAKKRELKLPTFTLFGIFKPETNDPKYVIKEMRQILKNDSKRVPNNAQFIEVVRARASENPRLKELLAVYNKNKTPNQIKNLGGKLTGVKNIGTYIRNAETVEPTAELIAEMKTLRASQAKNSGAAKNLDELIKIVEQRKTVYDRLKIKLLKNRQILPTTSYTFENETREGKLFKGIKSKAKGMSHLPAYEDILKQLKITRTLENQKEIVEFFSNTGNYSKLKRSNYKGSLANLFNVNKKSRFLTSKNREVAATMLRNLNKKTASNLAKSQANTKKTATQVNYLSKLKIPTANQFYTDQKARNEFGSRYTEIVETFKDASGKRAGFTNKEVKNINELHTMLSGQERKNRSTINKIKTRHQKILKNTLGTTNLSEIKTKHINTASNKAVYNKKDWYKSYVILSAENDEEEEAVAREREERKRKQPLAPPPPPSNGRPGRPASQALKKAKRLNGASTSGPRTEENNLNNAVKVLNASGNTLPPKFEAKTPAVKNSQKYKNYLKTYEQKSLNQVKSKPLNKENLISRVKSWITASGKSTEMKLSNEEAKAVRGSNEFKGPKYTFKTSAKGTVLVYNPNGKVAIVREANRIDRNEAEAKAKAEAEANLQASKNEAKSSMKGLTKKNKKAINLINNPKNLAKKIKEIDRRLKQSQINLRSGNEKLSKNHKTRILGAVQGELNNVLQQVNNERVADRRKRFETKFGKPTMFKLNQNELSKKVNQAVTSGQSTKKLMDEINAAEEIKREFNKNTNQLKKSSAPINTTNWLRTDKGKQYAKYREQIIKNLKLKPSTNPGLITAAKGFAKGGRNPGNFGEFGEKGEPSKLEKRLNKKQKQQATFKSFESILEGQRKNSEKAESNKEELKRQLKIAENKIKNAREGIRRPGISETMKELLRKALINATQERNRIKAQT